ncbi:hypothetical protein CAPTEDRAFT_206004 [Capitella teleta]|uniref:Uncharacterized protein n=1 Tax=Capitella teleta TaxID=283909 RepID=R7U3V6_CAPTE|nr:hypothetical protein CAPTEDRAFT_206004 [Capitella teleta]|eukprot:ELU00674.1 hypothetical protein CAPTEDRAFT_206004 [Capitella teleta]
MTAVIRSCVRITLKSPCNPCVHQRISTQADRGIHFMDEKNIPGPRSWPFVGSLYKYTPIVGEYTFHDRDATSSKMYKKYGKIVRQEITPGIVWYHLFDPDDIETVFRNESKAPQRMLLEGVVEYCKQRNRSPGINVSKNPFANCN